jgi:hypothetical protein
MLPNKSIMIDVTVVHPAAPSRTSSEPLAAVSAAEKRKRLDIVTSLPNTEPGSCRLLQRLLVVLVSAVQVLKLLRQASGGAFFSIPASSVGTYAAQCISVGLQRGNGTVSRRGAVAARAAQHSARGLADQGAE